MNLSGIYEGAILQTVIDGRGKEVLQSIVWLSGLPTSNTDQPPQHAVLHNGELADHLQVLGGHELVLVLAERELGENAAQGLGRAVEALDAPADRGADNGFEQAYRPRLGGQVLFDGGVCAAVDVGRACRQRAQARVRLHELRERNLGLSLDSSEDGREPSRLRRCAAARHEDKVEGLLGRAQLAKGLGGFQREVLCDLDVLPEQNTLVERSGIETL